MCSEFFNNVPLWGPARTRPGLHAFLFSQGAPAIELKTEAQMICSDNLIVPTGGRTNFIRNLQQFSERPLFDIHNISTAQGGGGSFQR